MKNKILPCSKFMKDNWAPYLAIKWTFTRYKTQKFNHLFVSNNIYEAINLNHVDFLVSERNSVISNIIIEIK